MSTVLLPLIFARRKAIPSVQTVGIAQFGLAAGTLLVFLFVNYVDVVSLSTEIQVGALFVNMVLLGMVLLGTIFGVRQATSQRTANMPAVTKIQQSNISQKTFRDYLLEEGLTMRQTEVAVLIARGHSVSTISEKLVISQKTAGNHISSIYKTLNLHSRQELITCYQAFIQRD